MGGASFVKGTVHLGGSAPYKFLHWSCTSKFIDLALKVFCIALINYAQLYGY